MNLKWKWSYIVFCFNPTSLKLSFVKLKSLSKEDKQLPIDQGFSHPHAECLCVEKKRKKGDKKKCEQRWDTPSTLKQTE